MMLDIACGSRKQPGYVGIDLAADADIRHDLFSYPWPIADGEVSAVYCSHFVEHIPHWRPGWTRDGWWLFWEEVARVMAPGAVAKVIHPYLKSVRAFQDPTHERFIPESTWSYLNAEWRAGQLLGHYDTKVDLDVLSLNVVYLGAAQPDLNLWDQALDLHVELGRRA